MQAQDFFHAFKSLVDREDQLINSRLSWLLTIEGFLFATLGISIRNEATNQHKLIFTLQWVIPVTGALISLIVLYSILRAQSSKRGLRRKWDQLKLSLTLEGFYPSPFGESWFKGSEKSRPLSVLSPGIAIPIVLFATWLILLIQ